MKSGCKFSRAKIKKENLESTNKTTSDKKKNKKRNNRKYIQFRINESTYSRQLLNNFSIRSIRDSNNVEKWPRKFVESVCDRAENAKRSTSEIGRSRHPRFA